jgi:leucyl-tRNA synthetase
MESLRFNVSVAKITELNNHLTSAYADRGTPREAAEALVLLLAPLAPHIAEELWATALGHDRSLAWEGFPEADPVWLAVEEVELPVQVNGKVRGKVTVPADADEDAVQQAALQVERVAAALHGHEVRRVVVVPGRMVNFVVS